MQKLFVALLILSLSACGGNSATADGEAAPKAGSPEEAEQALYQKAVDAHDEVMPKYFSIEQVSQKIFDFQTKAELNQEQKSQIVLVAKALDDANDGMMDWMGKIAGNEPENLRESKSHEEIMAFWQSMDAEMTEVKRKMDESLALGEELLQKIDQANK